MKVYLCGPMTGLADLNKPAFAEAAAAWREKGHTVINPGEMDGTDTAPREECLRVDLRMLLDCQAIVVLPRWAKAAGSMLEARIARELLMPVFSAALFTDITEDADVTIARHTADGGERGLEFDTLRAANVAYQQETFGPLDNFNPLEWAGAMAGPFGEACNLSRQWRMGGPVRTRAQAGAIADLVIYADLLAERLDIDLGAAVCEKLNSKIKETKSSITL